MITRHVAHDVVFITDTLITRNLDFLFIFFRSRDPILRSLGRYWHCSEYMSRDTVPVDACPDLIF